MIGYEVTLTCDLTEYHSGLVEGIKGIIVDLSCLADRFIVIRFPSINYTTDILWQSLDITDPKHIKEVEERNKKFTGKYAQNEKYRIHQRSFTSLLRYSL